MVKITDMTDGYLQIAYSAPRTLTAKTIKVPKEEFLDACRDFADDLALQSAKK